jgi:hypothetical protein
MTTPVELTAIIEDQIVTVTPPVAPGVNISTVAQPFTVVTVQGPPGPAGPPGTGARIIGEIPAGTKDGNNLIFTLANNYNPGTVAVYRNGLREMPSVGYSETAPNRITFTTAPNSDDDLLVDYLVG